MIKTTPRNLFLFFAVLSAAVLLYLLVIYPKSSLAVQLRNLELAQQHALLLTERTAGQPQFEKIKFSKYTARNGCLSVHGEVETEADIHFITNVVESSGSPVGVTYLIQTVDGTMVFKWYNRTTEEAVWIRLEQR